MDYIRTDGNGQVFSVLSGKKINKSYHIIPKKKSLPDRPGGPAACILNESCFARRLHFRNHRARHDGIHCWLLQSEHRMTKPGV